MRSVVFAHYDRDSLIEPYIIYYLKELKKVAETIVFVSDNNLKESESGKLSGIVTKTIAERHAEYDFGSYKRGYLYLKNNGFLTNCDELIFANDSCFGPLIPFQEIWTKMSEKYNDNNPIHKEICAYEIPLSGSKTCDFWGITKYTDKTTPLHIQSYFLVFKKQVFNSAIFDKFMKSVGKENTKMDVVRKYEIGLSQLLLINGFKMGVLNSYSIESAWLALLLYRSKTPFVKTMMIRNNFKWLSERILKQLWSINKTNYDLNLVLSYASRYGKYNIMRKVKNLKRSIIRFTNGSIYIFGKEYNLFKDPKSI